MLHLSTKIWNSAVPYYDTSDCDAEKEESTINHDEIFMVQLCSNVRLMKQITVSMWVHMFMYFCSVMLKLRSSKYDSVWTPHTWINRICTLIQYAQELWLKVISQQYDPVCVM
jgi:hypothetical protein